MVCDIHQLRSRHQCLNAVFFAINQEMTELRHKGVVESASTHLLDDIALLIHDVIVTGNTPCRVHVRVVGILDDGPSVDDFIYEWLVGTYL